MRKTSLALLATASLGLVATAQADLTWDWTYTGVFGLDGSPLVSGSGTLTTGPLSGGAYPITGIAGTFDGKPVLGLDSTFSSMNGYPDQTLYTPGSNGSDNNILSPLGLGFDIPEDVVNIFDKPIVTSFPYVANDFKAAFINSGIFTAVAAPEPSQVVSMLTLAGVGGAGLLLKLRRRK